MEFGGIEYGGKKFDENWHKLLGKHYFFHFYEMKTIPWKIRNMASFLNYNPESLASSIMSDVHFLSKRIPSATCMILEFNITIDVSSSWCFSKYPIIWFGWHVNFVYTINEFTIKVEDLKSREHTHESLSQWMNTQLLRNIFLNFHSLHARAYIPSGVQKYPKH